MNAAPNCVYVLATLDTKGVEAEFVCHRLQELGIETKLVDTGCLGSPTVKADVSRDDVFHAAETSLADMHTQGDRGVAIDNASVGVGRLVAEALADHCLAGVIGLGGSAGTTIAAHAMQQLPLGVPKLIVSTLASGQTRPFVGDSDICMLNSVVDIAGINRISRQVLNQAAAAMAGMVNFRTTSARSDKPLIAASMFGVTTPCVEHARKLLEQQGYEVLVFHATGNGGQAMEKLIAGGLIAGVLDLTTTELADELVGGVLSAGPTRLTEAAKHGVPQVVSVGALDMVNFGPRATVPDRFRSRKFHQHNANVTLMRTTPEECRTLGEEIGRKLAGSYSSTKIVFPLRGVSAIDADGQPFEDSLARQSLLHGLRESCGKVELLELDSHINDSAFATNAAQQLLDLLRTAKQ